MRRHLIVAGILTLCSPAVLVAQDFSITLLSGVQGGGYAMQSMSRLARAYCDLTVWGPTVADIWGEVWLYNPSGTVLRQVQNQSHGTKMKLRLDHDLPDGAPGGQYRCWANVRVNDGQGTASAPFNVPLPNSTSVASDGYLYRQFNHYLRRRFYQVRSGSADWRVGFATVRENYVILNNGCNIGIGTNTSETTNAGRFQDDYWLSGATMCTVSPACTTRARQTITVGGYQVKQHEVTFGCNGVSMP